MLLDEFFGAEKRFWDVKVLATDISNKALEQAHDGIYSNTAIAPLPAEWRRRYFKKLDDDRSAVADPIRSEVIFRSFNLMNPAFSFRKKFHVIFCRNVMIYFNNSTKNELVEKFYDLTEPGGYLFIGHAESLARDATRYKYVMPAVYRKE